VYAAEEVSRDGLVESNQPPEEEHSHPKHRSID
jgi:hypothetical protein